MTDDRTTARRRLLLGLLLLVTVGGGAFLLLADFDPDPEPIPDETHERADGAMRLRGRAAAPRSGAPRVDGAPASVSAELPEGLRLGDFRIEGSSRFQRRLSLGTWLRRLADAFTDGDVGELQVRAALLEILKRRLLLMLDGLPLEPHELRGLVDPARDPEGLILTASEDDPDELGNGARLRVWTQGTAYYPVEVAIGDALLETLNRVAGDPSTRGYDVVATPGLGKEVFPLIRDDAVTQFALGVYLVLDDLCLVRSTVPPALRQVVLKHELVHAWTYRISRRWTSRFVEEGLAEYLSRLRANDPGFQVPLRRFRANFALLLAILERLESQGIHVKTSSFQRLVSARPAAHYAMGYLGYLLAQAAMAYVGPERIEDALKARSEKALIDALVKIEWPAFLAFVRTHAQGGSPAEAVVIEDLPPTTHLERESLHIKLGRISRTSYLRRMGMTFTRWITEEHLEALLRTPHPADRQTQEGVRRFLDAFRAADDDRVRFVTDRTTPLAGAVRVARLPEGLFEDPDGDLARSIRGTEFAEALYGALQRTRGEQVVPFVGWGQVVVVAERPLHLVDTSRRTRDLVRWLAARPDSNGWLVVVSASSSKAGEADPVRGLLASLEKDRPVLDGVLVVDLAPGASDAVDLVTAFATWLGPRGTAVYWDPRKPLR